MLNVEKEFFSNITFRERAIFEGAISMGALFHQFIGTPVNKETVNSLEIAIEESLSLQPAIEKVEVDINLDILERELSEFEYTSLTGDMIDVKIYSKVNGTLAIIRMKFIEELNYPLMFVEDIQEDINENIQK
ncbi:MAG: dihydroneopterin aldolase family protein [Methanobrevibacter arboriphilus]|uniref:Dihydroneopterin aldolase n=1 Tax=Methanobrevibacter arboriphilus TaxID=39441 RepID=A0A843ANT5_METAZ|nr:dihydroneopterin aldolase family protein [Methanobrevibacter arboriphilus]MBF4468470.1 dihydroneopterin aldolase family protein [Methanobrevibacter arboriphilus]